MGVVFVKKEPRKIGLGFVTGRKNFKDVLTTYLECWGRQIISLDEPVELSLFVAYDLEYNHTNKSDYTNIDGNLKNILKDIHYINLSSMESKICMSRNKGVLSREDASLLFEKGYAGKRNAVLYSAMKEGMDAILYLDDDEYPLAVQAQDGHENWVGQQLLKTHLQYIDEADITNGYHCGYISPIPNLTFDHELSEQDFRIFIEAISNDVINWDTIKELIKSGGVTYADPEIIHGRATEIKEVQRAKFITGSNLCINLQNPKNVLPFFNPPGARGEDTFLSTCLSDKKVLRVPCYSFHDGFSLYTTMLQGVLPERLIPANFTFGKTQDRFYKACIGWIRYKPLYTYLTHPYDEYCAIIEEMDAQLLNVLPKLCRHFNDVKYMNIHKEFVHYHNCVPDHYELFEKTKTVWKTLIRETIGYQSSPFKSDISQKIESPSILKRGTVVNLTKSDSDFQM